VQREHRSPHVLFQLGPCVSVSVAAVAAHYETNRSFIGLAIREQDVIPDAAVTVVQFSQRLSRA
jgi:hypothetical protein